MQIYETRRDASSQISSLAALEIRQKFKAAVSDGSEPISIDVCLVEGELLVRIFYSAIQAAN